jgi:hypothetical protein
VLSDFLRNLSHIKRLIFLVVIVRDEWFAADLE